MCARWRDPRPVPGGGSRGCLWEEPAGPPEPRADQGCPAAHGHHHPRTPGPGEATAGQGHSWPRPQTVRGPQGPRPVSAQASGPGPHPGKEPAPWTEGGHASKAAPTLELEGLSAPALLRSRRSGGGAWAPRLVGGQDRTHPPQAAEVFWGPDRRPAQAVQVLAESAAVLQAAATDQGCVLSPPVGTVSEALGGIKGPWRAGPGQVALSTGRAWM